VIERCRSTGVGKKVGKFLYFHTLHLDDVRKALSPAAWSDLMAARVFSLTHTTQYRCMRIALDGTEFRFDEAPDFDTAREPHVGRWFRVMRGGKWEIGYSDSIWHHKFLWTKNDYDGFSVAESRAWSAKYAPLLKEPPKGTQMAWQAQLAKIGLR
jgi:hypothetical protein